MSQRVAEFMVDELGIQADAMVYAFTRADKEDRVLDTDILHALHRRLREIESAPLRGLHLFYETWNREHSNCLVATGGVCPLTDLHDFACQMHGEERLLIESEFNR